MNLQKARHAVFLESPPHSDAGKLQAQGRVARLSEMTPEERASVEAAPIHWIDTTGTADDHLSEIIRRKMRNLP